MPPKSQKSIFADYKKRLATNISDADIRRYFPDANQNIITYKDIGKYKDINQLLPHHKSYKIILIEDDHNHGHWVCIMRYLHPTNGDTIEEFDSYGSGALENEFKFIPYQIRAMLGETKPYLKELLRKAKKGGSRVVYNRDRLQADHDGINTCGRWTILRILMMKEMNYDLDEFCRFMDEASEDLQKPPDILVADFIR